MKLLRVLFFFAGAVGAVEPLPRELAQRLDLARMLPPGIGASVMMRYVAPAKIEREQKAALAFEAYLMATGFGVEPPRAYAVQVGGGPLGWLLQSQVEAMNPQGAALRAWKVYQDNFDPKTRKALEFPQRRVPAPETCRAAFVDDPYDYYEAALAADRTLFNNAVNQARTATELGRFSAAAMLLEPAQRPYRVIRNLLQVTHSDRHFAYAMQFTPLHNALLSMAREAGLVQGREVLIRYAEFLDRHWRQKRCAGNDRISYRGVIEEYNRAAMECERRWGGVRIPRLAEDAGVARSLDPESYAEREEDFRELILLRLQISGATNDEVGASALLRAVEDFRPSDKLPASTRELQRNFAFQELLARYRNQPWEKRIMSSWLYSIASSRLQREAPQVWWAALRDVREWIGKNRERRAMAESAGDPAMAAWLRLEALDPQ